MRIRTIFVSILAVACFAAPAVSSASALSVAQVSAIIGLLRAFAVDEATVVRVAQILGSAGTPAPADPANATVKPPVGAPSAHVPPANSVYRAGALGFDLSFNTVAYPVTSFDFAVVGVSGGKAFTDNPRLASEYRWARAVSTIVPTLYMNVNAPYGSTVAGHTSAPKSCTATVATSSEPTACAGYNFGYQAAAHAYTYAKETSVDSKLWWLDIEEANSWSADPAVNDATIQGVIDYLNAQGIRVGIYSVPRMWADIAGNGFIPTQVIGGAAIAIPSWFPIGIMNRVSAINTCLTASGFFAGSPVWIVQYEESATAVDQNIAC